MAPSIHPPCTPSASCAPIRCHPTPPPCQNPEKCLSTTRRKGVRPCLSAVSILSTRSKAKCSTCAKFGNKSVSDARSSKAVQKYLKVKSKENKLKRNDRLTGQKSYLKYKRKQGRKRSKVECCAGRGHRGRLKTGKGCCEIL